VPAPAGAVIRASRRSQVGIPAAREGGGVSVVLLVGGVALAVVGLSVFLTGRGRRVIASTRGQEVNLHPGFAFWRWLVVAGIVVVVVGITTTFVVVVPAGQVGVVTNFGRVEERTLPAGLQIVTPVAEQVTVVDVRVQPHTFQEISAASKEYQTVKLSGTMNYHIDPQWAYDLYRTVGLDFAEKVIDPAFSDFIKEVVPNYPIGEILQKRDEIRALAKQQLSANLSRYHILVDDIYLSNVSFSAEYEAAIEAKQVAQQQVQTEEQILAQRQIQAQQRVAEAQGQADAAVVEAKGDAQATVERAKGQADANTRLAASLSDPVLMYTYIQQLSDKLQVMLVPGGQQFLFDLKGLLGQAQSAVETPTPSPTQPAQ
jgi:prohibitin 2